MHAHSTAHAGPSSRSAAELSRSAVAPSARTTAPASDRLVQLAAVLQPASSSTANRRVANRTGLPVALKAGIEHLSGQSLDHVRVHRNSAKPAQLHAHAYAQGGDIHLAPGQERHLPHEAWHVVQQVQGRVRPTRQLKSVAINDDASLEKEADTMGARAVTRGIAAVQRRNAATEISGTSARNTTNARAAPAPSGGPVQRNAILSHNFEANENPIKTVIRFVSRNTGHSALDVFNAINLPKSSKTALRDEGNVKPISVKAYIDHVTGSPGRGTKPIQTAIGHLGGLEDELRGRQGTTYDGGHLLGHGWFNNWVLVDTAKNIAPQDRAENRSIFGFTGGWGGEEAMARKIAQSVPLVVTAYVNYAGGTYTVSLHNIAQTMLTPGPVKSAIDAMYTARIRFVVLNARVPKQYVLEHTVLRPQGVSSDLKNKNLKGGLATTWLPTRIPRTLLAPIEDAIHRNLLPFWASQGGRGRWGGAAISQSQPWYPADLINDAVKFAQFGIYYYMYGFNLSMTAAAALVANYFSSGTASSVLRPLLRGGMNVIGLGRWIQCLDGALTTLERTLTVDSALGYSKSIIAYLSSQTINWASWGLSKGVNLLH